MHTICIVNITTASVNVTACMFLISMYIRSFCNLTTVFAVEVYGVPSKSFVGYILLLITCLIGVAALIGTYFLYRYLLNSGKFDKAD